jgi:predicted protein tyrosine phosphatase
MRKLRILFVCSANTNRSPTFAKWFEEHHPEFEAKSSGCWHGYPDKLEETLLEWADWVFVMDISHEMHLRKFYPDCMEKVRVVGVSDQYDWNAKELIDIIQFWYDTKFREMTGEGEHLPTCEGSMCYCGERRR